MTVDTPIHTETLSWDDGDINWLTAPTGAAMIAAYATNTYNGDADWELCYIVELPAMSYFETTRNTYTDTFSDTACSVLQTGEFRRLQYQLFTTGSTFPYLTIHRNIAANTFKLSIYTFIDLESAIGIPTGVGDTYGWELFFDGVPVSSIFPWQITDTKYSPRYSGWKDFSIASCADIYDTFAISANSPALFTQMHPATLTTTLSSSTCSGSSTGVRFTDVGYARSGSGPRNGRIYLAYTNIAAADIDITFAECPP